jgi:hypothetical protein
MFCYCGILCVVLLAAQTCSQLFVYSSASIVYQLLNTDTITLLCVIMDVYRTVTCMTAM